MDSLEQLVLLAKQDFENAPDAVALENAKARYLGKTGLITEQNEDAWQDGTRIAQGARRGH